MTSGEVAIRVRREIGDQWDASNLHGVDLRRCLVEPRKATFVAGWDARQTVEAWIVLEETPGDPKGGYLIAFDEAEDAYGLADVGGDGRPCFIGYYGDFLTTLAGM
jgi:hypothetical protein